jgi:hypothetical protein
MTHPSPRPNARQNDEVGQAGGRALYSGREGPKWSFYRFPDSNNTGENKVGKQKQTVYSF